MIFCNFSVYSTLIDDCNGDFDLTLEFHGEDPPKYKRPTSLDGRQICFWPFLRLTKGASGQTGRFSVQEGQKSRLFGCPKGKNTYDVF